MGFMNKMSGVLNDDYNESITENGAVGYRTTGKDLLDLNFAVSSLRNATPDDIRGRFERAFAEDNLYGLKWLMMCRDAREGLGEKRTPRIIFRYLAKVEPNIAKALIPLIPEYGRFDDLFAFFGTKCEKDALKYIKDQFEEDQRCMRAKKPISLLAKWLASENASSKETKKNAKIIRNYLGLSSRNYRKELTKMRSYLKVVEVDMSAKNWSGINYEAVPSKANLLYKNAFLRNDEERRRAYLESLSKGEAKINSSVNFPHDIVHQYVKGSWYVDSLSTDTALEELWKALPDMVKEEGNTLVVRDGSGSMGVRVDNNSSVTALEVATALAIYFSERCSGEFKDKFITFSSRPDIIDLHNCKNLAAKIRRCYQEDDCSNTNIEATFDLILTTAIRNHMKQSDMPKTVLIISDMEFDSATYSYSDYGRRSVNEKLFTTIEKKFRQAGYKLPRLVFWNVNSRTGTIPVKENELGVALVSGFSVNVCKMVLSGELDPYKCLIEQLDAARYQPVEDAVKDFI